MKDSKAFWDKSATRYAKSPVRDEQTYRKKIALTQAYFEPDWSVLEFGCGTGSTAILHAPHVRHIVATDISDRMLEIAERKAREAGVDNIAFQQGTLATVSLDAGSFDAVLGLNVLHLIDDLDAALARVHGLLKPGGIFVSSTALVADIHWLWRLLIPLMHTAGLAPYVNRFGKSALTTALSRAGFGIEQQWQPNKESVFIVARKPVAG
ncbi:class I SAM-dependent methyltransferase [Marinobacter mobilis]|uniref:Methyltransferase domain-containing protein n=1 Tax=Marinobacter mobilis TaxID=488533 RepID=A0A1H2ZBY8_9GAMM|nr:class I SAM-dependent methyltransferase [Marinobacter mobilis]SDX14900.1 Methyltransferase domain-containing protein [Marinobacter mobilis]